MTDYANLCMNCMTDMEDKATCPSCGHRRDEQQTRYALPLKTLLQSRYVVGLARKSNGEGYTYIGYDTALKAPIELHEFFPQTISERAQNGKDVRVLGGSEVVFNECLGSFLSYSREVAHMRELSSIVPIYDIFEENHTAYTVSEWNESITLRYFVERSGGSLEWNAARQLFMPVLSALSVLHSHSIRHLGISPDTLFITQDGKMKLGSFSIGAVRQMDTDLPPDMVEGCAALEQYIMDYAPDEATDVYGFAASLYFALTGTVPPDALKRRADPRLLIPTSILHSLPPYVASALANALQVSPDKRTPTFERLRAELSAAPAVTAALEQSQVFDDAIRGGMEPQRRKKREVPGFVWVLASCAVMLAVFAVIGFVWMHQNGSDNQNFAAAAAASDASASAGSGFSSGDSSQGDLIDTPNLAGQNYQELSGQNSSQDSEGSSGQQDYQVLLSSRQFSDTVPEGCIISQQPLSGTKMVRGTAIVVVVSEGAAVRTLPRISGKTLPDASSAVTSAGFVPTRIETYSNSVPAERVIGYKDVKEGSQMAYGSKVVILVSEGPDPEASASSGAGSKAVSSTHSSGR